MPSSFLSNIKNFNPYIQQLPIDAMVGVGLQKQQQYDAGVEKVNNYLDSIVGLDVIHPEQKAYLKQRAQQLESEVTKVASGGSDWGNNQLTNQVAGLANTIVKDPIVQNAITSTAKYKQNVGLLQKAQAEGKAGIENTWDFNNQVESWLGNKDVKSSFNGAYTPYVDVRKKILDVINKDVPDGKRITEIPFRRNGDGTVDMSTGKPEIDPVMLQTTFEGKSASKIIAGVYAALDNNDLNQLGIEGRYHYRGLDANGMKEVLDKTYESKLGFYNDKVVDLENKKRTNVDNPTYQAQLDAQIAETKKFAELITGTKDQKGSYQNAIQQLGQNPEGFKANFYLDNYLQQMGNAFDSSRESYQYKENPYQTYVDKQKAFNLAYQKAVHDVEMDKLNYGLKVEELSISRERLSIDRTKAEKEAKAASGLLGAPIISPTASDIAAPTEATFTGTIKAQEESLAATEGEVLNSLYPGMDREKARVKLRELETSYKKGEKIEAKIAQYFEQTAQKRDDIEDRKAMLLKVKEKADGRFNVADQLKGETGLSIDRVPYSAIELANANNKLDKVISRSGADIGGGNTYMDFNDELAKQLLTPKEEKLYNIIKNNYKGIGTTGAGELKVIKHLDAISKTLNPRVNKVLEQKNTFINDELGKISNTFLAERYTLDTGNAEKRSGARNNVKAFLENAAKRKESVGISPNFDYDDATKIVDDEKTNFGVYKDINGYYLTMDKGGEKVQYIPIDPTNLNNLFPGEFNRPWDVIKEKLIATGNRTTNIRGAGDGRAEDHDVAHLKKSSFPNVTKYGISGDVEPAVGGGYQLRFYVYDPRVENWTSVASPIVFQTEQHADAFVKGMGDLAVEQLIGMTPEQKKALEDKKKLGK